MIFEEVQIIIAKLYIFYISINLVFLLGDPFVNDNTLRLRLFSIINVLETFWMNFKWSKFWLGGSSKLFIWNLTTSKSQWQTSNRIVNNSHKACEKIFLRMDRESYLKKYKRKLIEFKCEFFFAKTSKFIYLLCFSLLQFADVVVVFAVFHVVSF
jgi:hypothetical protein